MPKYEVYETIKKENKNVRENFEKEKSSHGVIYACAVLMNEISEEYINTQKFENDEETELKAEMVAEGKYCALVDCMRAVVKSRGFFSWFIHPYRNLQERRALASLERQGKGESSHIVIRKGLFGKAHKKDNSSTFNISDHEKKIYLEIEKGAYDEDGYVTVNGEKGMPNKLEEKVSAQQEKEKQERQAQEYRQKLNADIEENGDAFDDEKSFIDMDDLEQEKERKVIVEKEEDLEQNLDN